MIAIRALLLGLWGMMTKGWPQPVNQAHGTFLLLDRFALDMRAQPGETILACKLPINRLIPIVNH